jgi:hypothetical protein
MLLRRSSRFSSRTGSFSMSDHRLGHKIPDTPVRAGLKDILLNYVGLWEALREKSA